VIGRFWKIVMHKPQLELLLNAVAIMVCVFLYHLVRLGKELKQHPLDFESHSTVPGRDVPISDLTNEDAE
jgi:hypothetical protein